MPGIAACCRAIMVGWQCLPVFPAVPSTTVPPFVMRPFSSACLIINRAALSFTEPPGLRECEQEWKSPQKQCKFFHFSLRRMHLDLLHEFSFCQNVAACFLTYTVDLYKRCIANRAHKSLHNAILIRAPQPLPRGRKRRRSTEAEDHFCCCGGDGRCWCWSG